VKYNHSDILSARCKPSGVRSNVETIAKKIQFYDITTDVIFSHAWYLLDYTTKYVKYNRGLACGLVIHI